MDVFFRDFYCRFLRTAFWRTTAVATYGYTYFLNVSNSGSPPTFLLEDAKTCEITGSPPTFLLENAKTYEITDNSLVSSLLLLSLFCRPSYWKCLLVSLFSEYSNRPTIYLSYNADCVFWVFQILTHHPYEQCWLRFGLTLPSDFSTLFMACEDWFIVTEKISI